MPNQKPFYLTANMVTQKTGLTKDQMKALRELNPKGFFTVIQGKKGRDSYVYNGHVIPEILFKKNEQTA